MPANRRRVAHRTLATVTLATAALLATQTSGASKPETPTTLAGGKVTSVEEGKKLPEAKAAVFIDTRRDANVGKGRVPGALTAADREKREPVVDFDTAADSFAPDKRPKDKNAPVVFDSGGLTDWQAKALAVER